MAWSCSGGFWSFGGFGRVLEGFAGWQTADLNVQKKTRRRLANGMELQRRVLGVWGSFGGFCGLANGRLERS